MNSDLKLSWQAFHEIIISDNLTIKPVWLEALISSSN